MMSRKRKVTEIKVGTHRHYTTEYGSVTHNSSGGTNHWDKLIREAGLEGVELEVVLRVPKSGG